MKSGTVGSRALADLGAGWDRACADHPFARRELLAYLEATRPAYHPTYLVADDGTGQQIGAICSSKSRFHRDDEFPYRWLRRAASRWPITCTSVPGFAMSGLALSGTSCDRLASPLIEGVLDHAGRDRSPVVAFSDLPADHLAVLTRHADPLVRPLLPETVLPVAWDSFDAYLADLDRKTRAKIRNYRSRARRAGVELSVGSVEASCSAGRDIAGLVESVNRHHRLESRHHHDFVAIAGNHQVFENARVIQARIDGDLVATGTNITIDGRTRLAWFGLDHDRARDAHAYHLLLTESVRQAIEVGADELWFGPTSYVVKRQLGAELAPRYVALLPTGALGRATAPLLRHLGRESR